MKNIVVFIITILFTTFLSAQADFVEDQIVAVTLSNKEKIVGKVLRQDNTYLYLLVGSEKLTIPKKNILYHSIGTSDDLEKDEYRYYADQYFLTPSAIPVNKGEIYYRNIDLVGHLFSFGITDQFSINAGFESFSIFVGEAPVFIVTPKINIPFQESWRFGIGASSFIHEDDFGAFLFGNTTFGSKKNNFTLGLGVATDGEEIVDEPAFFVGYAFALSEKLGFYGDFISVPVFDDDDFEGIATFNLRFNFKGGIAFDIGAITNSGFDGAIPSLAVTLPIK